MSVVFVNLTEHDINIDNCSVLSPSGDVARVSSESYIDRVVSSNVGDVPIFAVKFGEVINLPEPQDNVCYIVSRMVAAAVPERDDLYVPFNLHRENGIITGCEGVTKA